MPFRLPRTVHLAIAAAFLLARPACAASQRAVSIAMEEESIPPADLPPPGASTATPSPAAGSPAGQPTSPGGEWEQIPSGAPSAAAPEASGEPSSEASPGPGNSAATETSTATFTPTPLPTEVPPAMDIGSVAPAPQVSDMSLDPMIAAAAGNPARAASLREVDQGRIAIQQGRNDDAIRDLGYAVSVDPTDSYAYFFLGRAYRGKKDYTQAITFFQRAEVGLAADPAWMGETYSFEGRCYEEAGKLPEAAAAYERALAIAPGNLTARVGVTRLSAYVATPISTPQLAEPTPSAIITPGPAPEPGSDSDE